MLHAVLIAACFGFLRVRRCAAWQALGKEGPQIGAVGVLLCRRALAARASSLLLHAAPWAPVLAAANLEAPLLCAAKAAMPAGLLHRLLPGLWPGLSRLLPRCGQVRLLLLQRQRAPLPRLLRWLR
jgi:hypothetical protein